MFPMATTSRRCGWPSSRPSGNSDVDTAGLLGRRDRSDSSEHSWYRAPGEWKHVVAPQVWCRPRTKDRSVIFITAVHRAAAVRGRLDRHLSRLHGATRLKTGAYGSSGREIVETNTSISSSRHSGITMPLSPTCNPRTSSRRRRPSRFLVYTPSVSNTTLDQDD